jgi:hypothetical protein
MNRRYLLATAAGVLLLAVGSALADPPPGKGKNKHKAEESDASTTTARLVGAAVFSSLEIQRIRSYYAAQPSVRGKPLPPGIAKNLARGKPLPPGIAKRYAPQGLVRELSTRSGYDIIVAGTSILLVEAASRVIRDIVDGAISQ